MLQLPAENIVLTLCSFQIILNIMLIIKLWTKHFFSTT